MGTPSLASFVHRFKADGQAFRARSWRFSRSIFYSLIVHVPKTQVVLELISNSTGGEGHWPLQSEPRHFFQFEVPPTKPGYLFPLHVSRAVRDLGDIRAFYDKVFQAKPTLYNRFMDGTEVLIFGGPADDSFSPRVSLQFVKRPMSETSKGYSAVWFQEYMLNVSRTYMTRYNSCWPIWGDNHVAVRPAGLDLKVLKDRLDSLDRPMYHPLHGIKNPGSPTLHGGPSVIYAVDPSGWTVQAEGSWPEGFLPDADTDNGNFYEYCGDPKYGQGCQKQDDLYVV